MTALLEGKKTPGVARTHGRIEMSSGKDTLACLVSIIGKSPSQPERCPCSVLSGDIWITKNSFSPKSKSCKAGNWLLNALHSFSWGYSSVTAATWQVRLLATWSFWDQGLLGYKEEKDMKNRHKL